MAALLELIVSIIMEFRITRWLLLGGLILIVIFMGGLTTAGGLGTVAVCGLILAITEAAERLGRRNRR